MSLEVDDININKVNNLTINEIVDNNFMDKDVSELVKGDFYLFHLSDTSEGVVTYFYRDGLVFYSCVDDDSKVTKVVYRKGTLQEFVDSLEG